MPPRTTDVAVKQLLGVNYDTERNPSLIPFIDTATAVVNRLKTYAAAQGTALTVAELELVERWLAAHYYTKMDPLYKSSSTADASASFNDREYLDGALDADASGFLPVVLGKAGVAGGVWLGKRPSEQIPVWERE